MYTSDWHIDSSASYDAQLPVSELIKTTTEIGSREGLGNCRFQE